MKKLLVVLLSLFVVFGIVGCSSKKSSESSGPDLTTYTHTYDADIDTLDYLVSDLNTNNRHISNFVEGLYAYDNLGKLVPAIAESYTVSEDGLQWTFKIREGVKWVTASEEVYADVTAHDFVAGLKHAADAKTHLSYLVDGFIANYDKYAAGEVDFDQVGVKAVDDYTLVYTLTAPAPYFLSMTTYNVFHPANAEFLASKGEEFGSTSPDSILYNSAYILTVNDSKSKISYKANENYWDKENVHIKKVDFLFDDGSDVYSTIKGFENGVYVSAGLLPVWEDFEAYKEKYAGKYNTSLPNFTTFGVMFNFNRRTFNHTGKDEAQQAAAKEAILNPNFRRAFKAAFDRQAYLKQSMPEDVALSTTRNILTYPEIVFTSTGESYGKLIEKEYAKLTGEQINLADGQDPFLSKEKALAYIEKAKEEGITFPVILDMPVISNEGPVRIKRANSLKESVESNTDGQILINLIELTKDEVMAIQYRNTDPVLADYDLNTFAGWGPDFGDPKTFVDIMNANDGAFLDKHGVNPLGEDAENDKVLEKVGLKKYTELAELADKETADLDKRYQLYAEAEGLLIADAIFLPQQQQLRAYSVSRIVPFTRAYGLTVDPLYRMKGVKLQADIVTVEQFEKAYQEWEAAKKN